MNLHKPKALHRFSERGLVGREWESAGERTGIKRWLRGAHMLQKDAVC